MSNRKFNKSLWGAAAISIILALIVSACGGAAQPKITLKLAINPWTGSAVNIHVAKILLEEQMGYKVEALDIDENAQFAAMAKGDVSATLEIWPSGHAEDYKTYIEDQKVVEDAGKLGVVGKIGWYIPTYLVDKDPSLATWEGIKANAAMFKTAETGDKGQFLEGDPSWVYYDQDIITNLGMDFQIVQAGSEQAILAAIDAAYSRQEPVIFYFWTPHSVHAKYKLTEVKLPAYTDACGAKAGSGGVDCDYPQDVLYKAVWGKLKDEAPDAYQFLKNMNYTNDDQIAMIADVELNGKKPEEAARAWVDAHKDTWQKWIPAK
jgi:glycine betaine/proline transport system substrate-binding protein